MPTLRLLESKKQVLERVKRGRAYVYRPLVTRQEMSKTVLGDLKQVLFGETLPSLMLGLIDADQITPDDLKALKDAVKQLESRQSDL